MRLNIRVISRKQCFGAFNRQALGDVDELAAAVIALTGVTFRVFVGQHRALRGEHPGACEILRGDQFDMFLLSPRFIRHRFGQFGVKTGDGPGGIVHGAGRVG